jgi:hypothetical protein
MAFSDLLAFRVCVQKSAVILMGVLLDVTCLFSLQLSVFSVLIMMCLGFFFFGPDSLVLCKLPVPRCTSLYQDLGSFQLLYY